MKTLGPAAHHHAVRRRKHCSLTALERLERRACPATLSLTGPDEIAENASPGAVTLSLSEPQATVVTVMYRVVTQESTARFGQDFGLTVTGNRQRGASGRIVFAPGQTEKMLLVSPIDDARREGPESLTIELFSPRNARLGDSHQHSIVLVDDDTWTASLVGPESVAEGEIATYEIRLSSPATTTQTYHVRTVGGTANPGSDFVPLSRLPVVIPRGQTSGSFQIPVLDDGQQEREEQFSLVVTPRLRDSAPVAPLTVTIAGGGTPPVLPTITVADVSVAEGDNGTTQAVVSVSLSTPATRRVTVAYATQDDTATLGDADYLAAAGVLTFEPGEDVKTVTVSVRGDTRVEADEALLFMLMTPIGATIGAGTARITITNDDDAEPSPSSFQIDVVFPDNSLTGAQQGVFRAAAARWSEIILADLPDVSSGGRTIDDVEILATAVPIDGNFGVLGRAGPTRIRGGSRGLPWQGIMEFDTADVARMMTDGSFTNVIVHEMAHVLGLGTLWQTFGLVSGIGTNNPIYTGANAVREYQTLSGSSTVTSIPLENTGGAGTAGGHWRETVFGAEIMTGYLNPGDNPISRVTVGALEDLGYGVDYAAADPFTLPLIQPAGRPGPTAAPRSARWPVLLAMRTDRSLAEGFHPALALRAASGDSQAEPISVRAFRSMARRQA